MKKLLQTSAEAWVLLLTFLLPLKFGVFAGMPEAAGLFPEDLFSYLVINWSATAFGLLSAPALLLCLAAFPAGCGQYRRGAWAFAMIWSVGLVLGSLPGLCRVSSWEFAPLQLNHFGAIGSYALAVYLLAAAGEEKQKHLCGALWAGFLLTVWFGIEQYFWGFARARAYLEQQAAAGMAVGEVLQARTDDTRVFATFTSCNSLAGYLLLLTPLMTFYAWKLGEKVEPARISRWLFAGITGAGGTAVFLLTKSRAGYLALAMTLGLLLLFWPMKKWKKVLLIGFIVCGVLAGAWYIHAHGRGFRSMTARADYLRSSVILLAGSPVTGCGWGEFFFRHPGIKKVQDKEAAHDPHNLLATQAQAGLGAVLLALAGMALPFGVWLCRRKRGTVTPRDKVLLAGLTGFLLHAMMDIDLQIPGLMASFFAAAALLLCREVPEGKVLPRAGVVQAVVLPTGILLAGWTFYSSGCELHSEMLLEDLQKVTRLRDLTREERQQVTPDRVNRALLRAADARPRSSHPWSMAGDFYWSIGDPDQADMLYQEALKRSPCRAGLYAMRARIALSRGDRAGAEKWMSRARALFPHHPGYRALPQER